MQRALIKLLFTFVLLATSSATFASDSDDTEETFSEGFQYKTLEQPLAGAEGSDGKVQVLEFFWYGCPHCYSFEPHIKSWLKRKADYIEYVRIPAIFTNPRWAFHAQAYFTAEVLQITEEMHHALFDAIQKQRRSLNDEDSMAEFFAEVAGVSREDFDKAWKSFYVRSRLARAKDLSRRSRISGVPSIVVNGKFVVESGLAGSMAKMLDVSDFIAKKERDEYLKSQTKESAQQ